MKTSINGNLILSPYKKVKELETKQVATGFNMVQNKIGIESLELLVDAAITLGDNTTRNVSKGTKIYFKQHTLETQKWPREIYSSEIFPNGFVIGDVKDVLFFEEPNR